MTDPVGALMMMAGAAMMVPKSRPVSHIPEKVQYTGEALEAAFASPPFAKPLHELYKLN